MVSVLRTEYSVGIFTELVLRLAPVQNQVAEEDDSGPKYDDPLRFDREHDAYFPGADRSIGIAAGIFLGHTVHMVHGARSGVLDHATAYFHPKVGAICQKDCS